MLNILSFPTLREGGASFISCSSPPSSPSPSPSTSPSPLHFLSSMFSWSLRCCCCCCCCLLMAATPPCKIVKGEDGCGCGCVRCKSGRILPPNAFRLMSFLLAVSRKICAKMRHFSNNIKWRKRAEAFTFWSWALFQQQARRGRGGAGRGGAET